MTGNKLIQETVFYDKYAKWNEEKGRRETWEETVDRVIKFFKAHTPLGSLAPSTQRAMKREFLAKNVLPAMRIVQMAGPALERCNVGAYNCCYTPVETVKDFADILYILMQGTGVGFSVEKQYVEKLPKIALRSVEYYVQEPYVVPDTTEGWCDSLLALLEAEFNSTNIKFDYSQIRPAGTRLKTKGGTASGPEPLIALHAFVRKVFKRRRDEEYYFLRPIDVYDIVCQIGAIVEVGGVRRAALMCLCDLDDVEMRDAKQGEFWHENPQRSRSNNSAVYTTDSPPIEFASEFAALRRNGTGERGIFNRKLAQNKYDTEEDYGTNPCGEIILLPRQFCNLSIAVCREADTEGSLMAKVEKAAVFGTLQATLTNFAYISPQYKENCERERLLGVDITGQLDNPIFGDYFLNGQIPAPTDESLAEHSKLFSRLVRVAIDTNESLAKHIGITPARATTTVKPSGNSSQLLDCASGLHPRFAPYYIRRLRIGAGSPVAKVLEELGVYGEEAINEPTVKVFEFPVKSPDTAITRHDSSAIKQLKYWLYNSNYTEHTPSCTVYVKHHEWEPVEQFVRDFFMVLGGISFLPYNGGVYKQAPYEEISKEHYDTLIKFVPENVDWPALLKKYEHSDTTTSSRELACIGGVCDI